MVQWLRGKGIADTSSAVTADDVSSSSVKSSKVLDGNLAAGQLDGDGTNASMSAPSSEDERVSQRADRLMKQVTFLQCINTMEEIDSISVQD